MDYLDPKEQRLERSRRWRANNKEHVSNYNRKHHSANRSHIADTWRLRAYNITPQEYEYLLRAQGGVCVICQKVCSTGRPLAVDHDHNCCAGYKSCGKCVRALLCNACNRSIGAMKDDPILLRRAAMYVEVLTPEIQKELFEERAAIKQFDGKMPREEAETQAGLEQLRRLTQ